MNILLCCFQTEQSYPIRPYRHWRENFKRTLERMGHRVLEPQGLDFAAPLLHRLDRKWISHYRLSTTETLLHELRRLHNREGIDLFFSYFYSLHVLPEMICEIERMGIPTVNFFCDNLREFRHVSELVRHYTLNWVPEKEACRLYERQKAPYLHLPMACDPDFYQVHPSQEIPQITMVGSGDGLRVPLVAQLFRGGLPLHVYGSGWVEAKVEERVETDGFVKPKRSLGRYRNAFLHHWERLRLYGLAGEFRHLMRRGAGTKLLKGFEHALHPAVSHEEMLYLGANSAVFLGINRCPHIAHPLNAPLVYSRLRDIEGPMMGACYLTEYCEDVAELYEVGKEIAVYRNSDELVAEANRLLRDPSSRSQLRRNGQRAARSRHTWAQRFQVLFRTLSLVPEPSFGVASSRCEP